MIIDGRSLPPDSLKEADICIVGAGVAGITLATVFANSPYRVIVLESGGFDISEETESLNEGEVETPLFGPLEGNRQRFFGGTSNHWAGFCAPLEAIDFSVRSWVENSGWPITLEDIQPYYRSALDMLRLPSQTLDYVPNEPKLKYKDSEIKYRFIKPLRFGHAYRETLENAKNIEVILNSNLVKIHDSPNSNNIASLEAATLTGLHVKIKAKRYILACGALENTRLLLTCINQPMFAITKKNDWLGKCFMQHPHIDVGTTLYFGRQWGKRNFEHNVGPTPSYQKDNQLLNYSLKLHEYTNSLWDNVAIPQYLKKITAPNTRPEQNAQIRIRSEQAPSRQSYVSLSDKKDKLGLPQIKIHWQLGEQDIRTIKDSTWLIARILGANNSGIVQFADWIQSDKFPDYVWGGCHHMGTIRMSQSPENGVVDADCKVHGINNLYVAGSAVFPTSGWANPTFTIIALALRLADHLKQNHK